MINPLANQLMSGFVINIGLKQEIEVVKVVLPKAGQPRGGPIDRLAQFHSSIEESKLIAGQERLGPIRKSRQRQGAKLAESFGDLRQPSGSKAVFRLIEYLAGSQVADGSPITTKGGGHDLSPKTVSNLEPVRLRRTRHE